MNTILREFLNIVTGTIAFSCWFYLAKRYPEHSLKIAGSCIIMLLGFSGRETLLEIIRMIRIAL